MPLHTCDVQAVENKENAGSLFVDGTDRKQRVRLEFNFASSKTVRASEVASGPVRSMEQTAESTTLGANEGSPGRDAASRTAPSPSGGGATTGG